MVRNSEELGRGKPQSEYIVWKTSISNKRKNRKKKSQYNFKREEYNISASPCVGGNVTLLH